MTPKDPICVGTALISILSHGNFRILCQNTQRWGTLQIIEYQSSMSPGQPLRPYASLGFPAIPPGTNVMDFRYKREDFLGLVGEHIPVDIQLIADTCDSYPEYSGRETDNGLWYSDWLIEALLATGIDSIHENSGGLHFEVGIEHQVVNPDADAVKEADVRSLTTFLGLSWDLVRAHYSHIQHI